MYVRKCISISMLSVDFWQGMRTPLQLDEKQCIIIIKTFFHQGYLKRRRNIGFISIILKL